MALKAYSTTVFHKRVPYQGLRKHVGYIVGALDVSYLELRGRLVLSYL